MNLTLREELWKREQALTVTGLGKSKLEISTSFGRLLRALSNRIRRMTPLRDPIHEIFLVPQDRQLWKHLRVAESFARDTNESGIR